MTVREATFVGSGVRVQLGRGSMRLEARLPADAAPRVGDDAAFVVPAEAVWRFPQDDPAPSAAPTET
jgi:hypothetical protein